ncbi:hypothetical protein FIP36_17220 [Salmonella enterica]|nr:hypothetical protein [Salmonella enterica]EEX1006233.1 hypothetical protein [Escherichia coli]
MTEARTTNAYSSESAFSTAQSLFSYQHVNFSIERLLTEGSDSQLEYLFQKSAIDVRTELKARFDRGERFITTEACDNFCALNGCQGHQFKDG